MRYITLSIILLPILSFAQKNNKNDSIRMANRIVSLTEIKIEINSDSTIKSDTVFDMERYNEFGKIIEMKYVIGAKVLHKYIYDNNSRLVREIRLTPPSSEDIFSQSEVYSDTMTLINNYYLNGVISVSEKKDLWGVFEFKIIYKYNTIGELTSKHEVDTFGNIHDFEIHKLKYDGKRKYSVYNHEQMTSDIVYEYDNDILTRKTRRFNKYKSQSYYDKVTGNINEIMHYSDKELSGILQYHYNDLGLIDKIISYEFVDELKRKSSEVMYIYNKNKSW